MHFLLVAIGTNYSLWKEITLCCSRAMTGICFMESNVVLTPLRLKSISSPKIKEKITYLDIVHLKGVVIEDP